MYYIRPTSNNLAFMSKSSFQFNYIKLANIVETYYVYIQKIGQTIGTE